jgi:glutaredoxin
MFVRSFWRKQQLRKLSVLRLKALGYTPRFSITYKGPGWRHLNTKNDTNVEKLLQKDKTDTDLSENSIHKAQDDMHLLSDSDRDGSQPIKENAFPLREEHYRFNPAKSSDASSPGKEDSEQPKLKSQDQDKHSEGIAEEENKTLQTKEIPSLQDKSNGCNLHAPGYDTFGDLRSSILFVDKTDFILKFDQSLPKATCILRPRRSGKSLAISMLKEFYSLPKIDVMSYFSDKKEQESKHESSKSPFEGTKVFDPEIRKQHFEEHESEKAESFIKDNMNQWPVIVVDLQNITFSSRAPTQSEIRRKLLKYGIQEVFEQYDYVLFIRLIGIACIRKNIKPSKENIENLFKELNLHENATMKDKIQALGKAFENEIKDDL